MKKLAVVSLICFSLSACSSLNEVKLDSQSISSYIGEKVKVTTISGEQMEFQVESATEQHIEGEGQLVKIEDIQTLEVEAFSPLKSISLSAGLYMLGAIIITIVVL
ncbi:hypothetical protein KO533_12845 [Shewanella sp. NKUCC05_KAH]|uniref:hypothetical protein n=1 Tax=unclassified Shewanella TaxID=196818 RepID=UPI001BAF3901|nr:MULTISPECIES: hypothetical protein [unclassified Shewanella]MBS0041523.1 hypothetical protein [Shewanella sp. M16]MBW3527447.1 hypothetical protein [Shewanella sp. NKUCC05_KAH]